MANYGPDIDLSGFQTASLSSGDALQVVDTVENHQKFTQTTLGDIATFIGENTTVTNAVSASYVTFATGSGKVILAASGSGKGDAVLYVNISGSSYYINLYNAKA